VDQRKLQGGNMEPNKLTPESAMTIGAILVAVFILSIVIAS
jgi:hypothetical protein